MPDPVDNSSVDRLLQRLGRIRSSLRRTVLELELGRIVAFAVPALVVAALLDFAFRLPDAIRWILLLAGIVLLVHAWRRHVWPAIRFTPSLVNVALKVEGRLPSLAGRLASGVDFASVPAGDRTPLMRRSLADLDRRASSQDLGVVVDSRPAHRIAIVALGLVVLAGIFAGLRPVESGIAARRILAPWSDAAWPARTGLVAATADGLVHPRGEPLRLAADLVKGDPDSERVIVRVRMTTEGRTEDWRTLVMTRQQGNRFERIVDGNAEMIEFEFATSDATTDRSTVRLVPAPAIESAVVTVEPPAYASRFGVVEADLGPGTDRRSRLPRAVLEGSTATLDLVLSRAIPVPRSEDGSIDARFLAETMIAREAAPSLAIDSEDPRRWRLEWNLEGAGDVEIRLRDEDGLTNLDPIRYRIDTVPDRAPSTTIVDPSVDRTVTPSAMVRVQADARDDVGIAEFAIEASLVRGATTSRVERLVTLEVDGDVDLATDSSIEEVLDVSLLEPKAGDVVELVSVVRDEWTGPDGPRDLVRSGPRRLRVVSELDLVDQLQSGLASVRRSAIRIEGDQAELTDRVDTAGADRESAREQDRLGDRLEGAGEMIEGIEDRLRENRIEDDLLEDVLEQASEMIESASEAADRAVAALDEASRARAGANDPDASEDERARSESEAEEAERQAEEAQREVRDELTDLASMLDRGEDAWVVSRRIERLAEDLASLQERTGELSERTMGRERNELDPEDRRALDELAREQGELAERAEELLEELEDRADAMEAADPTEAAGLREAAQQARQEGLEEEMREAEERARENQLQQAQQAQQRAAEAIEGMQEAIEESRKAVVDELRRRMESLAESLRAMLNAAEDEVIALSRLIAEEDDAGTVELRVEAMILLQRNVRALSGEAALADERIGRIVSRAADNQSAAITDLRAAPPDLAEARASEERGVSALREALELAEEAAEELAQQQADAQRERLIASYRAVLDRQTGVRLETGDLADQVDGRPGRRQLIQARRLANGQAEVGDEVAGIEAEFVEVSDSLVFSMTHGNLDRWIADAVDRLREGTVDDSTVERQVMVMDALAGLIEALEQEQQPQDDPFGQEGGAGAGAGGQDGGGEGGPQPLIPPIAELKMLRSMQVQILDATRRLDQGELPGSERDARLADLARMQADLHGVANALVNTLAPASDPPGPRRPEGNAEESEPSDAETGDES